MKISSLAALMDIVLEASVSSSDSDMSSSSSGGVSCDCALTSSNSWASEGTFRKAFSFATDAGYEIADVGGFLLAKRPRAK